MVGNPSIFGLTISTSVGSVRGILAGAKVLPARVSLCLLRRTGIHVVSTVHRFIGRSPTGFPVGMRGCNGASSTAVPVLVSRLDERNGLGGNSGLLLDTFNTKFAAKTYVVR